MGDDTHMLVHTEQSTGFRGPRKTWDKTLHLFIFNIPRTVQGEKSAFLFPFCPLLLWKGFISKDNILKKIQTSHNIERRFLILLKNVSCKDYL